MSKLCDDKSGGGQVVGRRAGGGEGGGGGIQNQKQEPHTKRGGKTAKPAGPLTAPVA